jgi:hypothetical protein
MDGITSRTIVLLGISSTVGAASDLTSDLVLAASGTIIPPVDAGTSTLTSTASLAAGGGEVYDAGTASLVGEGTLILVDPGYVYTADADMTATATLTTTTSPVFRLVLPRGSSSFTRDRLWQRYPIPTGITMLVTGATVTLKEYVSDIELEDADIYYLGGYRHQISAAERNTIVAAGYGDLIEEV